MSRKFTPTEIVALIWAVLVLSIFTGVVYVAIHFIHKFW